MDTIKKFKDDITKKLTDFKIKGEIFAINEVAANMMAGIMMMVMVFLTFLCLGLNEIGLFTADKTLMRTGAIMSIIIQAPISAINQKYRGDAKWLKTLIAVGLILQCGTMSVCLGHNVTLLMLMPVIISV